MRYINRDISPKYCSEANCMLEQDCISSEIEYLFDALSKAIDGSDGFEVRLSDGERDMMERLLELDGLSRRPRRGPSHVPAEEDYSSSYDKAVELRMKAVSELSKASQERTRRINSESVYFGPDGKPVSDDDASQVGKARLPENVDPHVVDDPMSALDILSHNAAVTRMRVEAETPRTGHEAVAARGDVPGMPVLAREAQAKDAPRQVDVERRGFATARSDKLVEDAESRNYGRK